MLFPLATIFDRVQSGIGSVGYPMIFGLLLACGMGLPLPEDIPLLFAGYFVADGRLNLVVASIVAWCGIIGGDCILYFLGYKFGLNVTKIPFIGTHINRDRIKWAHDRFETYGIWVVAIGRLFAGIRGAMVLTAGTIRFNIVKFLIADGLAAVFSGGLFMALGYWARLRMGDPHQLEVRIDHYKKLVTIVITALVLAYLGWLWWQKKQREKRKKLLIQHAHLREAASHQD